MSLSVSQVAKLLKPICKPEDLHVNEKDMEECLERARIKDFDMPARIKLLEELVDRKNDIAALILNKTNSQGLVNDFELALPTNSVKRMTQLHLAPILAKICNVALTVESCSRALKGDAPPWPAVLKLAEMVKAAALEKKAGRAASAFYTPSAEERAKEKREPFDLDTLHERHSMHPGMYTCLVCGHSNVRDGADNGANQQENERKFQEYQMKSQAFEKDKAAAAKMYDLTRKPPVPQYLPVTLNCCCYMVRCSTKYDGGNCVECLKEPGAKVDAVNGSCSCEICKCPCDRMVRVDKVHFLQDLKLGRAMNVSIVDVDTESAAARRRAESLQHRNAILNIGQNNQQNFIDAYVHGNPLAPPLGETARAQIAAQAHSRAILEYGNVANPYFADMRTALGRPTAMVDLHGARVNVASHIRSGNEGTRGIRNGLLSAQGGQRRTPVDQGRLYPGKTDPNSRKRHVEWGGDAAPIPPRLETTIDPYNQFPSPPPLRSAGVTGMLFASASSLRPVDLERSQSWGGWEAANQENSFPTLTSGQGTGASPITLVDSPAHLNVTADAALPAADAMHARYLRVVNRARMDSKNVNYIKTLRWLQVPDNVNLAKDIITGLHASKARRSRNIQPTDPDVSFETVCSSEADYEAVEAVIQRDLAEE